VLEREWRNFKMIKEFTYEPYKTVTIQPSNSSYGKYVIKLSEVTFKFFWSKSQAQTFADSINNK